MKRARVEAARERVRRQDKILDAARNEAGDAAALLRDVSEERGVTLRRMALAAHRAHMAAARLWAEASEAAEARRELRAARAGRRGASGPVWPFPGDVRAGGAQ